MPRRKRKPSVQTLVLPVLPVRNTVLFPHLFMPLAVGRPSSIAAVEQVLGTEEKTFVAVAQRDAATEQPGLAELYNVGTRAVVKKVAKGEGGVEMLVQGVERVQLLSVEQTEPYLKVRVAKLPTRKVLRTFATDEPEGFLKVLIAAESDRILGFTMIGAEAHEVMAVVQTALRSAGISRAICSTFPPSGWTKEVSTTSG